MLKLSWKFGGSKWYPYWVIVLTSSSGTNYVPTPLALIMSLTSMKVLTNMAHFQYHSS